MPSLPNGAGGESTNINLSGLVNSPGNYSLPDLQAFAPVTEAVSGDTYTGVPLWNFVNPSDLSNILNQIVVTTGTDGYEVVLSLAELDPALGGNLNNLLPYTDTGGNFPASGIARTILPTDNKHGRWMSNLNDITVEVAMGTVPEPASITLIGLGFLGMTWTLGRRKSV